MLFGRDLMLGAGQDFMLGAGGQKFYVSEYTFFVWY